MASRYRVAKMRHRGTRVGRPRANGGPGRGRTADTAIFSRVLYQLSYRATGEEEDYPTWPTRLGGEG